MLKKLSLIIFIAVLLYSQAGYYFVLRHAQSGQKEAIKEKILSQLKDEELAVISLSNNKNIYWEENGKEFLLNGEMYDIVKTKTIDGKILLYCINDKIEKKLVDRYNTLTKRNSSADKKGKNAFDNSFNLFVYQDHSKKIYFKNLSPDYSSFSFCLPQNFADQASPPPKA